jgi:hypothetical protein
MVHGEPNMYSGRKYNEQTKLGAVKHATEPRYVHKKHQ